MKNKSLPTIHFREIRAHRGTIHGGFEELGVQIFRCDTNGAGDFVRVEGSGGDGGVEAFRRSAKGTEIGFQAKYFEKLSSPQWKQISASVKTAIENHPLLVEYRIAVPLDRTKEQEKKWTSLVCEWRAFAKMKGFEERIEFVWWGASEIHDLLTKPQHFGKLQYWFGTPAFTECWIQGTNDAAIATLDRRYTPQHHVRTNVEELLEGFALTSRFRTSFSIKANAVVQAFRESGRTGGDLEKHDARQKSAYAEFQSSWLRLTELLGDGIYHGNLTELEIAVKQLFKAAASFESALSGVVSSNSDQASDRPADKLSVYYLYNIRKLLGALREFRDFITRYKVADLQFLLITGDAGVGKSHILANLVETSGPRQQVSLILLGELFSNQDAPWKQLCDITGWEGTIDSLLSAMNHAAEISGHPAIICVDALNETPTRSLWRTHLQNFAAKLEQYPCVRLLISCRKDFLRATLPDAIREQRDQKWGYIEHDGFGPQLFAAVAEYFRGYKIVSDHFPPLLSEFENPLFLKTVCEAFENSRLSADSLSLKAIMGKRLEKLCEKLRDEIDCPASVTRSAVALIANEMAKRGEARLIAGDIRLELEALFRTDGESASLYTRLKSNGFLTEVGNYQTDEIYVRFQFERFADYFLAEQMLSRFDRVQPLKEAWDQEGFLANLGDEHFLYENASLIRMLSILLPERFSCELVDFFPMKERSEMAMHFFLTSVPWRSARSFSDRSRQLMESAFRSKGIDFWVDHLMGVAARPSHPYNADFIHTRLLQTPLPERDASWTTKLSRETHDDDQCGANNLVAWILSIPPELIPDDQAVLLSKLLCWFFASCHRPFRDRATFAVIKLLSGRARAVIPILREFNNCDDPYVVERVYAAAAGIAVREQDSQALSALAREVYDLVFAGPEVRPHILMREYARCVLEAAHYRGLLADIPTGSFRPPYTSIWPTILVEEEVLELEKRDGLRYIASSIRPESMGMYGDFGRYVMGSRVRDFQRHRLSEPPTTNRHEEMFDDKTARRWVLQRVLGLGWNPELFEWYEQGLRYRGREAPVLERVSKKYQWIALHELLGYLSDHFHLEPDWGGGTIPKFQGAWQLYARDFDPSLPFPEPIESRNVEPIVSDRPWWDNYPDPYSDSKLNVNRSGWVASRAIQDFGVLLEHRNAPQHPGEWLTLCGYYSWDERLPFGQRPEDNGQLHMWAHVRSWLVKKKDTPTFLTELKRIHFWGSGCCLLTLRDQWLGEYPWGKSCAGLSAACVGHDGWLKDIRTEVIHTICEYQRHGTSGLLPTPALVDILKLRWAGRFDFKNSNRELVVFSREENAGKTPPCLVHKANLLEALAESDYEIVWTVVGGRSCFDGNRHVTGTEGEYSAVYSLENGNIAGGLTKVNIETLYQK